MGVGTARRHSKHPQRLVLGRCRRPCPLLGAPSPRGRHPRRGQLLASAPGGVDGPSGAPEARQSASRLCQVLLRGSAGQGPPAGLLRQAVRIGGRLLCLGGGGRLRGPEVVNAGYYPLRGRGRWNEVDARVPAGVRRVSGHRQAEDPCGACLCPLRSCRADGPGQCLPHFDPLRDRGRRAPGGPPPPRRAASGTPSGRRRARDPSSFSAAAADRHRNGRPAAADRHRNGRGSAARCRQRVPALRPRAGKRPDADHDHRARGRPLSPHFSCAGIRRRPGSDNQPRLPAVVDVVGRGTGGRRCRQNVRPHVQPPLAARAFHRVHSTLCAGCDRPGKVDVHERRWRKACGGPA